jgi:hypothetical protein
MALAVVPEGMLHAFAAIVAVEPQHGEGQLGTNKVDRLADPALPLAPGRHTFCPAPDQIPGHQLVEIEPFSTRAAVCGQVHFDGAYVAWLALVARTDGNQGLQSGHEASGAERPGPATPTHRRQETIDHGSAYDRQLGAYLLRQL